MLRRTPCTDRDPPQLELEAREAQRRRERHARARRETAQPRRRRLVRDEHVVTLMPVTHVSIVDDAHPTRSSPCMTS